MFKLNNAGANARHHHRHFRQMTGSTNNSQSPKRQYKASGITNKQRVGSSAQRYEEIRNKMGHKALTTLRDKNVFSQVDGVSFATISLAQQELQLQRGERNHYRASTSDPFQEDSLFHGNLLMGKSVDATENVSIESSQDKRSKSPSVLGAKTKN